MKNLFSLIPAIIITLLFYSISNGQKPSINMIDRIDSMVTSYMSGNKIVGISIGVVKDGQVYISKGYGTAEVGKLKPVDSLTNFLTCSITKLFTATAIMQLVEQDKIDLNKKLIFYLPDFKMKDERYKDITLEQMLSHTSGLHWDMELKHSLNDSNSLKDLVYSLNDKVLDFTPGTKFNALETYSNAAFDILGYLVQKISGKYYASYIQENILLKSNMLYSSFDYSKIPIERRSSPHILKNKKPRVGGMYTENAEHSPSANLNSCSLDLCNWMIQNLNIYNNSINNNAVLNANSLAKMWTSTHIAPQNENISIGLGWWITKSDKWGKYVWHVGNNPGFSSILMIFPELNIGITVLCNGQYAEQIVWNKIPFEIIKLLRGN